MAQSKITSPEGFRAELEYLIEVLDTLSVEQAAVLAGRLKDAAPSAARRCSFDDLDELQVATGELKNRLRWKWRRKRTWNIMFSVVGTGLAVATSFVPKPPASGAPNPIILLVLVVVTVLFVALSLWSLAESGDWKDDVAKAVDEVGATLAKELAGHQDLERPQQDVEGGSTAVRIDSNIAEQPSEPDDEEESEERRERAKRKK